MSIDVNYSAAACRLRIKFSVKPNRSIRVDVDVRGGVDERMTECFGWSFMLLVWEINK